MKSPGQKQPTAQPPEPGDGRKRTIAITLLALGAGAVTIGMFSGRSSSNSLRTYRDVASCEAGKPDSSVNCRETFTQALNSHERSAPGFSARENCEKEYGTGNCVQPSPNSGRSNVFIPAMAGFLLGQRASGGFQSAPLYRRPGDPEGEFRQSAAFPFPMTTSSSSSSSSSSRSNSSLFRSSSPSSGSTTSTSRPSSSSSSMGVTTTSRGGFGASSRGSSSS